jgi:hypothetical protein
LEQICLLSRPTGRIERPRLRLFERSSRNPLAIISSALPYLRFLKLVTGWHFGAQPRHEFFLEARDRAQVRHTQNLQSPGRCFIRAHV